MKKIEKKITTTQYGEYVDLCLIGDNLIGVIGTGNGELQAIDAVSGETKWTVKNAANPGIKTGQAIFDENAIYISRTSDQDNMVMAGSIKSPGSFKRCLTAHNPENGEEIWVCDLTKYDRDKIQFTRPLAQTDKYIIQPNNNKIQVIDKTNGTVKHSIKFKNEETSYRIGYFIEAWKDKIIVSGSNKKKATHLIDIYDPETGVHEKTIDLKDVQFILSHIVIDNTLYLLLGINNGTIYKIDLVSGKIEKKTPIEQRRETMSGCTGMVNNNGVLQFVVDAYTKGSEDKMYTQYTYDTTKDTAHIHNDLNIENVLFIGSELECVELTGKETVVFHSNQVELVETETGKSIAKIDLENKNEIRTYKVINNSIYVLQGDRKSTSPDILYII